MRATSGRGRTAARRGDDGFADDAIFIQELFRFKTEKKSDPENTVSRRTTKTVQDMHDFEIIGYRLKKGIGIGNFVRSGTFTVAGYDWAIRFYPDGSSETSKEYVAIFLELLSSNTQVRASYDLRLVNRASGETESIVSETVPRVFRSYHGTRGLGQRSPAFIERSKLELKSAGYIMDDCLTIQCILTVAIGTRERKRKTNRARGVGIYVPPSNLSEHFGKLLLDEETADVVFNVEGEAFPAHKLVLATRSPVFKAELHGQMKESTERCITVEDMKPDVFKALLFFAYTDEVPEWDDLDEGQYCEIIGHLLVAADRYAMDRLKLICANILQEFLDEKSVATTLALADQNNCPSLKDVCIDFMASTDYMDAVVATQGYVDLKRNNPSVLVDVLERTSKFRKRNMD